MKKNTILENIHIDKLIFGGKGLALAPDGRKIIIAGGAIPGSVVNLRVLRVKSSYLEAQIVDTVKKSPLEQELPAHFQVYGGCKWLPINYPDQLRIKAEQVRESFHNIEKYWNTNNPLISNFSPLSPGRGVGGEGYGGDWREIWEQEVSFILREPPIFHPIVPSPEIYGYRNKVEFSWGKYISEKEGVHDTFRFGFHAQAQFDRIIDCDFCVLADDEINAIFREINEYSRKSGLPTYDPKTNIGFWRHLVVRKAHYTDEIMIIFSVNHEFEGYDRRHEGNLLVLAGKLMERFPHIVSVYLLQNSGRADIVTGEALLLKGKPTITEHLLGKTFEINPKSFFQTNSLGAEKLYTVVRDMLRTQGGTLLDLYAGTGTIGILLADRFEKVYSVELVTEASRDGAKNAQKNGVDNIVFVNQKTEVFLKEFLAERDLLQPQTPGMSTSSSIPLPNPPPKGEGTNISLVIDPPRDGMHPSALPEVLKFGAKEIIYVSCNPATLARDLDYIFANSDYRLTDVTPVDMFPHTHHIETVARLEKS